MSMSIPLVWDEVIWDESWGTYQGREMKGHSIVDGGLLANFPIELFISDAPYVTRLMGPKGNDPILGMLIDESQIVQRPAVPRGLVKVNVDPYQLQTVQRILRLVNTMTSGHDKMVIEEFRHLVVKLPAGGYGTTEFDLSDPDRNALVDAGRKAMQQYFDAPPKPMPMPVGRGQAEDNAKHIADEIATRILQ